MQSRFLRVFAIALLLTGCDKNEPAPKASDPAPQPTTVTAAQTTAEPEPAAPTAPEGIAEEDVRETVDAWLEAQNTSNFDAYSKLYATKFEGIKRVGPKKSSYDREGWLKDRNRMFSKKMTVTADDMTVNLAGNSAVVRFVQTWASGNFKDVGPKQLVIVADGDELRVAREEMLASEVVGTEGDKVPPYSPRRLGLMESDDMILLAFDDDAVETGPPKSLARGSSAIAAVTEPGQLSGYLGETFRVHGSEGTCDATVKALHVVARAVPHFGQVDYWNGKMDEPRLSDVQVAREMWQLADGAGRVVVGKLDSACKGARWAQLATQKDSVAINGKPAAEGTKSRALSEFRKLPGYKAIQKDYESYEDGTGYWDAAGGANVTVFETDGATKWVAVTAFAGDGCGGFLGEFWAIFEVAGSQFSLMTDGKAPGDTVHPETAVVVDGVPRFVSDVRVAQKVGAVWRSTYDASVPFYDCPC